MANGEGRAQRIRDRVKGREAERTPRQLEETVVLAVRGERVVRRLAVADGAQLRVADSRDRRRKSQRVVDGRTPATSGDQEPVIGEVAHLRVAPVPVAGGMTVRAVGLD